MSRFITGADVPALLLRARAHAMVLVAYGCRKAEILLKRPQDQMSYLETVLLDPIRHLLARQTMEGLDVFNAAFFKKTYAFLKESHEQVLNIGEIAPRSAVIMEAAAILFSHGPYGDEEIRGILQANAHPACPLLADPLIRACRSPRDFDRLQRALILAADVKLAVFGERPEHTRVVEFLQRLDNVFLE